MLASIPVFRVGHVGSNAHYGNKYTSILRMMNIIVIIVHTRLKILFLSYNKQEKIFGMGVHGANLLPYFRISYKKIFRSQPVKVLMYIDLLVMMTS